MREERIGNARLILGDCRGVLPGLSGVYAVVSDPPYGTGGWRRTEAGNGSNPSGRLIREVWDDGATDWLALLPACPVLTFWPAARTGDLLQAAAATGRTKHRALYMRKLDPKPQPAGRTSWSVEPIWALSEEGFQLYGGTDWFECSTPRLGRDAAATGHPYEKPLGCLRWLISKILADDGAICDPFMGSGTTGAAAIASGRKFVGIEQDARWFDVACRRIEEAQRQADLFIPSTPDLSAAYDAPLRDLFAEPAP